MEVDLPVKSTILEQNQTILWFEYLLDSSLLEKQFKKDNSGLKFFKLFII